MSRDEEEEHDLHLARLNMELLPCPRHNNPARIERGVRQILCKYCYCYMPVADWGTWEEAVKQWNDRPYVEELFDRWTREVKEGAILRTRYTRLMEVNKVLSDLLAEMDKNDQIDAERMRRLMENTFGIGREK